MKHLFGFVLAVALAVGAASLVVSNTSNAAPTLPNYWGLAY
jgi:di/tricarboxylate transporter